MYGPGVDLAEPVAIVGVEEALEVEAHDESRHVGIPSTHGVDHDDG
jgi:hypothetical protein